jgi:hypothetical protein
MPSEGVRKVAGQIVDDLGGAAYYADPQILAGILKAHVTTPDDADRAARAILAELTARYAQAALRRANRADEIGYVAGVLERHGLR